MLITPSFKKSLIVEQFQENYLKPANKMIIFFSCRKLVLEITNGFLFTQLLSFNRLVYLRFVNKFGNERVTQIVDKERCIKEHTFFELLYVSCIYFTS